jgi:hypothetical protein
MNSTVISNRRLTDEAGKAVNPDIELDELTGCFVIGGYNYISHETNTSDVIPELAWCPRLNSDKQYIDLETSHTYPTLTGYIKERTIDWEVNSKMYNQASSDLFNDSNNDNW